MSALALETAAKADAAARPTVADYVLGGTAGEHRRLITQARLLEPYTERFFRDAGIGEGDRVLDVGSGMGDVAMILARLVGPGGSVVGIDRDGPALEAARARVAAVGCRNVEFVEADIADAAFAEPFDAIAGRMVLLFQPDPAAVLRLLMRHLRPRGRVAFQEPCWSVWRPLYRDLPLRAACIELVHEAMMRAGVHDDMEVRLRRDFVAAGLPLPQMRLEVPYGAKDRSSRDLASEILRSVHPRLVAAGLRTDAIGDLGTLAARLEAELEAADVFPAWVGLAGAWARVPS